MHFYSVEQMFPILSYSNYASLIGTMRHVVSMVANHVALSSVTVDKGDLFLFTREYGVQSIDVSMDNKMIPYPPLVEDRLCQ